MVLDQAESASKRHLDLFIRFSTARGYVQQTDTYTDRHTDTQITERRQQQAASLHSAHAMRPNNISFEFNHLLFMAFSGVFNLRRFSQA